MTSGSAGQSEGWLKEMIDGGLLTPSQADDARKLLPGGGSPPLNPDVAPTIGGPPDAPAAPPLALFVCGACDKAFPVAGRDPLSPPSCPSCRGALRAVGLGGPIVLTSASPPPSAAGISLGRYRLHRELGRGGMGIVYEAWDSEIGRPVALKMLSGPGFDLDELAVERLLREARAAGRLHHPSIIAVHDVGCAEGRHYFTMDLVRGRSLEEWLRGEDSWAEFPMRKRVEVLAQVAEALGYAHGNGVVHRDIKPSNILIDEGGRAILTDFGLAKDVGSTEFKTLTQSGAVLGTLLYMSPEQASGDSKAVGPASDVFSFGVLLYRALTGEMPFQGEGFSALLSTLQGDAVPPSQRNPKVHRDLETICLKCLEKSLDRRFPDAGALSAEMKRYLDGEPILSRPASGIEKLGHMISRHRAAAMALLMAVAAVAAILGLSLSHRARDRQRLTEALERGRGREAAGDWQAAFGAYEATLQLSREQPEAQAGRDRCKARLDALQAEQARKDADEKARRDAEPLIDRAAQQADPRKALDILSDAIRICPKLGRAYHERARVWSRLGEHERCLADLDLALKANPPYWTAYFTRAMERIQAYDHPLEAVEDLRLLLQFDSKNENAVFAQAYIALLTRQWNEAVRLCALARDLRMNPLYVRMLVADVDAQRDDGKQDAATAIQEYDKLLKDNPKMAVALVHRGNAHRARGEFDAAMSDLNAAVEADPRNASAYTSRGVIYEQVLFKVERGLEDHETAIEIDPKNGIAHLNRGRALKWLAEHGHDHPEALLRETLKEYDLAVSLRPDLLEPRFNRGVLRYQGKDLNGAKEDFDAAVDLAPNDADAWLNLGVVCEQLRDRGRAIECLKHAIEHAPPGWRMLEPTRQSLREMEPGQK